MLLHRMAPLNLKVGGACAVRLVERRSRAFLAPRSHCLKVFIGSGQSERMRACFSAREHMK
jgi:hypothetical protein